VRRQQQVVERQQADKDVGLAVFYQVRLLLLHALAVVLKIRLQALQLAEIILSQFKGAADYQLFMKENALYMKEKKETEKYLIES